MSSNSLNDSSRKYLTKSSSRDDGSQESEGYSNSVRSTEDKLSTGLIEQDSIYENNPSTRSIGIKISPISKVSNSIDERIESSTELEDVETSTKLLQTESYSFDSHKQRNYNEKLDFHCKKMIAGKFDEDLQLPLAEEQDLANFNVVCGTENPCSKKGFKYDKDPVENLVSATLAFKEASNNQCDLLRAQTSAINRLATAIEDQNVMMNRFHNTIAEKTSVNNSSGKDNSSTEDKTVVE